MLSKYAAVLLIAGARLYLLTRREQRHWLAHPGPYLALAIALGVFAPVIVWNAQHGWVLVLLPEHAGRRGLQRIRPDWLLKNVAGQALAILPWLWAGLVAEFVTGFGRRPPQPERQFVSWLSVPPIVLFTGVAAWSSTSQHHFHWATPGYLLLFLPLGETVRRGLAATSGLYRRGLAATAAVTLIAIAVLTSHIATGWLQHLPVLSRVLTGIEDPDLRVRGHDGPPAGVSRARAPGQDRRLRLLGLVVPRGQVDYGLKGGSPSSPSPGTIRGAPRLFDRSERYLGKDGILVTTKTAAEVGGAFGRYFERTTPLGGVEVGGRGRVEVHALPLPRRAPEDPLSPAVRLSAGARLRASRPGHQPHVVVNDPPRSPSRTSRDRTSASASPAIPPVPAGQALLPEPLVAERVGRAEGARTHAPSGWPCGMSSRWTRQ